MLQGKFASANQKHYPDLGSDISSVWNFCACFAGATLQVNQYCNIEKCQLFSQATSHLAPEALFYTVHTLR